MIFCVGSLDSLRTILLCIFFSSLIFGLLMCKIGQAVSCFCILTYVVQVTHMTDYLTLGGYVRVEAGAKPRIPRLTLGRNQ